MFGECDPHAYPLEITQGSSSSQGTVCVHSLLLPNACTARTQVHRIALGGGDGVDQDIQTPVRCNRDATQGVRAHNQCPSATVPQCHSVTVSRTAPRPGSR